jgi:hypothetical protein
VLREVGEAGVAVALKTELLLPDAAQGAVEGEEAEFAEAEGEATLGDAEGGAFAVKDHEPVAVGAERGMSVEELSLNLRGHIYYKE